MIGFTVIKYKNNRSLDINKFENYLLEKDILNNKNLIETSSETTLTYQYFEEPNNKTVDSKVLVKGSFFGEYQSKNTSELNYSQTLNLINGFDTHQFNLFAGSGVYCQILNNEIFYQSDPSGFNRLFYCNNSDFIIISTDLLHIVNVLKNQPKLRMNGIISFLFGREVKWPFTIFEDVFVTTPLSSGKVSYDKNDCKINCYSDFYSRKRVKKKELTKDILESYKLQSNIYHNKKIAVAHSGGYDSNCLVKLYKEFSNNDFTAVSMGYVSDRVRDNNIYDETGYAEKIAKKNNIKFKKFIVDKKTFFTYLDDFILSLDQPSHDGSSNYVLNRLLSENGYEVIVSGMGGDALYSSKVNYFLANFLFTMFKKLKALNILFFISSILKYRGPFSFLKDFNTNEIYSLDFDMIFERQIIFNSPMSKYVSNKIKNDVSNEFSERVKFYEQLDKKAKNTFEKIFTKLFHFGPGEYNAVMAAKTNGLRILLPFLSLDSILKFLNGISFNKINNRDFETRIFGGINKADLVKSKSGFSIPYSEWVGPVANEVISFYKKNKIFETEKEFDIDSFYETYKSNPSFSNSIHSNVLIWRLLVLKKYINLNKLSFEFKS